MGILIRAIETDADADVQTLAYRQVWGNRKGNFFPVGGAVIQPGSSEYPRFGVEDIQVGDQGRGAVAAVSESDLKQFFNGGFGLLLKNERVMQPVGAARHTDNAKGIAGMAKEQGLTGVLNMSTRSMLPECDRIIHGWGILVVD